MGDEMVDAKGDSSRVESLAAVAAKAAGDKKLPPVHLWNPPFCGDIDMRIARDGSWHYLGTPIGRKPMVRLFSTILRRDDDGKYYLVTPVEKVGITVDDAPFLAVEMTISGEGRDQVLTFRSSVDDLVTVDADHPIRVVIDTDTEEPSPYVRMRSNLDALISRAVFYDLVDLAEDHDGRFGVWSSGHFFPIDGGGGARA